MDQGFGFGVWDFGVFSSSSCERAFNQELQISSTRRQIPRKRTKPKPGLLFRNLIQVTIMGIYSKILWLLDYGNFIKVP